MTIYVDSATIAIAVKPSGIDVGPYYDTATAVVTIKPSGSDSWKGSQDSATARLNITPSGVEFKTGPAIDSAVVRVGIEPSIIEGAFAYSDPTPIITDVIEGSPVPPPSPGVTDPPVVIPPVTPVLDPITFPSGISDYAYSTTRGFIGEGMLHGQRFLAFEMAHRFETTESNRFTGVMI